MLRSDGLAGALSRRSAAEDETIRGAVAFSRVSKRARGRWEGRREGGREGGAEWRRVGAGTGEKRRRDEADEAPQRQHPPVQPSLSRSLSLSHFRALLSLRVCCLFSLRDPPYALRVGCCCGLARARCEREREEAGGGGGGKTLYPPQGSSHMSCAQGRGAHELTCALSLCVRATCADAEDDTTATAGRLSSSAQRR